KGRRAGRWVIGGSPSHRAAPPACRYPPVRRTASPAGEPAHAPPRGGRGTGDTGDDRSLSAGAGPDAGFPGRWRRLSWPDTAVAPGSGATGAAPEREGAAAGPMLVAHGAGLRHGGAAALCGRRERRGSTGAARTTSTPGRSDPPARLRPGSRWQLRSRPETRCRCPLVTTAACRSPGPACWRWTTRRVTVQGCRRPASACFGGKPGADGRGQDHGRRGGRRMRSGDRRTRYYGEAWRGGARPRPRRRDGRGRVAGCRTVVAFLLLFLCGAPPVRARQATPFLETDHWVHAALRRLNGLGLLGAGHDPGGRSITERRAERLLRSAVSAAAGTPYEEIARGYLDRFTEEFGEPWVRPADGGDALGLAGGVGLGVRAESGGLTAATGYRNTAGGTDPRPIPDRESVGPAARLRVYGGRYAAGQLVATTGRDGAGIGDAYVLLPPASLGIWFGRRAVGFGPGAGGGVVLSADAFTGGGVAFLEDVTLPGFLRHLGPVRAETFLARVQGDETVRDPWF